MEKLCGFNQRLASGSAALPISSPLFRKSSYKTIIVPVQFLNPGSDFNLLFLQIFVIFRILLLFGKVYHDGHGIVKLHGHEGGLSVCP